MDPVNKVCPVCTLFLRPGITLKEHLKSHPKQKVIEALVKLSSADDPADPLAPQTNNPQTSYDNSWNSLPDPNEPRRIAPMPPRNHVFIYQQSMSTSGTQGNVMGINPLASNPQYVIPTVFNQQNMMQMMPYVYQQQQLFMASNEIPPPLRAISFDLPPIPPCMPLDMHSSSGNSSTAIITEPPEEDVLVKESSDNKNDKGVFVDSKTTLEEKPPVDLVETDHDVPTEKDQIEQTDNTLEEYESDHDLHADDVTDGYAMEEFVEPELVQVHEVQASISSSPKPPEEPEWENRFHNDFNRGSQTPDGVMQVAIEEVVPVEQEYFYLNQNIEAHPEYSGMVSTYEQSDPIYTSTNILQSNDYIDMEGMHVIINDFSQHPIISQVENFENTTPDRSDLMTIGEIVIPSKVEYNDHRDLDESVSRESSIHIHTDERMPPRGELSGQESIDGASDTTWNRIQYHESTSGMAGNSYDLLARESWEQSDSSDVEVPPLQSRNPTSYEHEMDDAPTIVSFSGPPLNFKCSTCGEGFVSFKDRKDHEVENHGDKKSNIIGADLGKKKVKKLIIKAKDTKVPVENNFDNIFSNRLKIESKVEQSDPPETVISDVKIDPCLNAEVKSVCSICDEALENIKALKLHKLEVHKVTAEIRHKCATCSLAFQNEFKFTEHLQVHPLECRMCGKLFYRRQNFQLHMKRHLGIKPYKCESCEKGFITKQKLDEHRNTHTGEAPIKCTLCSETFRRHSNLVQHRNRHHFNMKKKVRDYICYCGEIFHTKKKLAWHKEIHDAKPKACLKCSEKFIHMSSLTRHMRRAHNEKFLPNVERDSENVECPICKGIYLKSSLEVHIRNHSGQRPFSCLICNKNFTTKWNLKLHKWTHASRTSKPFKCDQCKGAFIRESDYTAHMNSHKSVRPYTCNYCGAQFIRKYNCQRHVKEHESGKTFNCQVCGKSFHRSYYLKDHMRVHSGVRPYSCHICGKTSTTKSNHNKHVQIHHAREPVSTEN